MYLIEVNHWPLLVEWHSCNKPGFKKKSTLNNTWNWPSKFQIFPDWRTQKAWWYFGRFLVIVFESVSLIQAVRIIFFVSRLQRSGFLGFITIFRTVCNKNMIFTIKYKLPMYDTVWYNTVRHTYTKLHCKHITGILSIKTNTEKLT